MRGATVEAEVLQNLQVQLAKASVPLSIIYNYHRRIWETYLRSEVEWPHSCLPAQPIRPPVELLIMISITYVR